MPGWSQSPHCVHTLMTIQEPRAFLGFGGLLISPSPRPSPQWRPGYGCCSCLPDSHGLRFRFYDKRGRVIGRPDLLYRNERLAIEYDGGNHRDRLVEDDRRQNDLVGAGLRLLRFTAPDVYGSPDGVVMQVRRGLAAHRARLRQSGADGRMPETVDSAIRAQLASRSCGESPEPLITRTAGLNLPYLIV